MVAAEPMATAATARLVMEDVMASESKMGVAVVMASEASVEAEAVGSLEAVEAVENWAVQSESQFDSSD